MNVPFFRKRTADLARSDPLLDWETVADDDETVIASLNGTVPITERPTEPIGKAPFGRIGLVSVEEDTSQLPVLLDDVTQSPLMQKITLPRNPRIASDEFYALEAVDMIVFTSAKGLGRDMVRWLGRLRQMGIPIVLIVQTPPERGDYRAKLDGFSHRTGFPIIPLTADNLNEARQSLVTTTLQVSPPMALALAAHLPAFREMLVSEIMHTSTQSSINTLSDDRLESDRHLQLVKQISIAYGCGGRAFKREQAGLRAMMRGVSLYTQHLVDRLPIKDEQRRRRLAQGLTTLFIGYGTAVYHGATPPSLRHEVLPKVWRLYRASRQPALE